MKDYFQHTIELNCDCYVADFTEDSHNERGVEISVVPFEEISEDIPYFHLKKEGHGNLSYLAVNLEENTSFTKGIDNCECVFSSLAECRKPWLMFLEMKYCDPKNTGRYVNKACRQMKETAEKLERENIIRLKDRRVYFVYSVPRNHDGEPFGFSETSQDDVISFMKENSVRFLGYNKVLIATADRLFPPRGAKTWK